MHRYKLFCDNICENLSPVTYPPQHTHTMTPEGNTLLYLLLKSLLPPTLEVHTRSPPGIYEHSRGKRQRSLCRFKVTLPKTQNAKRLSQVYISAKDIRFWIWQWVNQQYTDIIQSSLYIMQLITWKKQKLSLN